MRPQARYLIAAPDRVWHPPSHHQRRRPFQALHLNEHSSSITASNQGGETRLSGRRATAVERRDTPSLLAAIHHPRIPYHTYAAGAQNWMTAAIRMSRPRDATVGTPAGTTFPAPRAAPTLRGHHHLPPCSRAPWGARPGRRRQRYVRAPLSRARLWIDRRPMDEYPETGRPPAETKTAPRGEERRGWALSGRPLASIAWFVGRGRKVPVDLAASPLLTLRP